MCGVGEWQSGFRKECGIEGGDPISEGEGRCVRVWVSE